MASIAIVHHSGYGHTRRMAEFVQTGVTKTGAEAFGERFATFVSTRAASLGG